jgi:parvulin-like peptidyl-prolyl isomerase
MVERIRTEIQRVVTGEGGGKRMSQSELDAYRRQLVLLGVTVTTVLLVLILGIGAYYQYLHLPRQTVAVVGDEEITRSQYWDYRRYNLLAQINQYQQIAQFVGGDQAQQYQQLAFEADQEFRNIEDASIDPFTLNEMIDNLIILNALDEFGIEISDQDVEDYLVGYFTGMPLDSGEVGPSADPTAEAWATATAEAQEEEMQQAQQEMETEADDNGDPDLAEESDDAEAVETPEPEPTPSEEDLRATATANQTQHEDLLLNEAGLSHDEFVEMFIIPDIARERIQDRLAEEVPVRTEQVRAAHILVATEEAARLIYEDLIDSGRDFAEVAEAQSTDSQTAPNGGDLGWFPRGVMVPEFNEVVFDLDQGQISEPFQTEFGWHIATVQERDDDRPVELSILNQLRQQAFQEWLEQRRSEIAIDTRDIDLPDDPGAPPGQFQPPASAPQPPQPEMPPEMGDPIEGPDPDAGDDLFDGDDPFESIQDDD